MTLPKIEEWIKEVEERPGSATTILKVIYNRLKDLTEQNEALRAENIALQDGSRVEEYRKHAAALDYQLELLKRHFGSNQAELTALAAEPVPVPLTLLVYNARGRILRIESGLETGTYAHLGGELSITGEAPRLLAIPLNEEILLLFSSGRVSTCAVEEISLPPADGDWSLDQAALPDEPHAGERLVCITPISRLAMADFFLQSSRRGCIKKTMTSISETIFENHYLGKSTIQRMDQPFDLTLCLKKELFVLVTHAGRLLGLEVDDLSYALEERIRLDATDHVVAGFIIHPDEMLLCMTQNGKVISRSAGFIAPAKSATAHGQALISPARLEQGVRFIGAAPARETDRVALLDEAGNLSQHPLGDLTGAGLVPTEAALVAFAMIPSLEEYPSKTSPAKKSGGEGVPLRGTSRLEHN
jgi:hypothetical protein